MSEYATTRITPEDAKSGFSCGKHPLDDYFARHAVQNDQAGINRAFVLLRQETDPASLPRVLGFYTLSMTNVSSKEASRLLTKKLPRYPMPAALLGRLAVDQRAKGRRLGEKLLLDALRRVVEAADLVGCLACLVDAKDESALTFYAKYGFVALVSEGWPRRMLLPLVTAKAALFPPREP